MQDDELRGQLVDHFAGRRCRQTPQLESALRALEQASPEGHDLVLRIYRDRKTLRQLEALGRGNRRTSATRLASALGLLQGYLIALTDPAATSPAKTLSPCGDPAARGSA
jgi:hypothetical protein